MDFSANRNAMNLHPAHVAGRLAHDFGNYLTSILGFAELAFMQVPPEAPARGNLSEVLQAARGGADWVQRLSFLGRPKPSSFESTDVVALAQMEEKQLRERWGKKVKLKTALGVSSIAVETVDLQHVLAELLNNAGEAMAGSGTIALSTRKANLGKNVQAETFLVPPAPGDYCEIAVTDTGAGLPPAVQRKLRTEPFFSTKPGQRGFGLLIVRWVVEQYGGGMEICARAKAGAVARVFFPLARAQA
jgi:two-component system cell cycle sensor histidine kinase/response regulator CckA